MIAKTERSTTHQIQKQSTLLVFIVVGWEMTKFHERVSSLVIRATEYHLVDSDSTPCRNELIGSRINWELPQLTSGLKIPTGTGPETAVTDQTGLDTGSGRFQTGPNSKFKFKFQKMKNS